MSLSAQEKQRRKEERKRLKYEREHRIIYDVDHKLCVICNTYKPATTEYYYKNISNSIDGLSNRCLECEIKIAKQWAKDNKERHNELNRKAFKENRWNIKNIRRENSKKRRENGKHDEWLLKNPDKMKIYNQNRQHKNHNIRKTEWNNCKEYFNNECAYCGLPLSQHYYTRNGITKLGDFHKEHVDHKGSNNLSNCVPSCGSCNDHKWKFDFEEWYNLENKKYSQERYDKIIKWLTDDYKLYIEPPKPKGKYTRKSVG